MTQFSTVYCQRLVWGFLSSSFLWGVALLMPNAVQSQTTNPEREIELKNLYDRAHELKSQLPKRDYRGIYLTAHTGTSPVGHVQSWYVHEECDCDGNVISRTNQERSLPPFSVGLSAEGRFSKYASARLTGSFATLNKAIGDRIVSDNGDFTHLRQSYNLQQWSVQTSMLFHFGGFYAGAGAFWARSEASGFDTQVQKEETTTPQYRTLKADVKQAEQTQTRPVFFIGYRIELPKNVFLGAELGGNENAYFNVQVTLPLSARTKKSLQNYSDAHKIYKNKLAQAVALDKVLHPQKFAACTDDTSIFISSGGGRCN